MPADSKPVKKVIFLACGLIAVAFGFFSFLHSSPPSSKNELQIYSQQYGYQLWKDMKKNPISLSLDDVIAGMKAYEAGETISDDDETLQEYLQKMVVLRKQSLDTKIKANQKRSVDFLAKVAKKPNIVTVEGNRLFYKVTQTGKGPDAIPTERFHYTITTIDNEIIVDTRSANLPKKIPLETALPAFSKGVQGMTCGERRIIYAHPAITLLRK